MLATDTTPWVANTVYSYRLAFRPGGFEIEINDGATNIVDWAIPDSRYTGGRFGYYINSMQNTAYSRPQVAPIDVVSTTYGQACAGLCGIAPEIIVTGNDAAGGSLNLRLMSGLGGAPGFIAIGFGRAAIPFGANCFLNINPSVAFLIGPMATSGSLPGSGMASFNVGIPAFIPVGTVITFQSGNLDPRPFVEFALSRGVEVITK